MRYLPGPHVCLRLVLLLPGLFLVVTLLHAAEPTKPVISDLAAGQVIQFKQTLPQGSLVALPDATRVQLPKGGQVRVADLRRLTALSRRMKTGRGSASRLPTALRTLPAAKGRTVSSSADLEAALNLPDKETLQLPSGKRLTVAQLKFIQPLLEERLGRSLTRSKSVAPPIQVGPNADWKTILQKPDATRLQSPDGTIITVADVKQRLAADKANGPTGRR
ncbi:hypothetical protein [Sedimenticola selenatireducens]|uniref:Uncharacterized protein n=1 Tax=Sedimenticola selenatireducens TaxID=191960 RepID=A0A557SKI7_9GAMM|nr:hypothetical protein [Sedimenticola selenatireducens]TVO77842.1 hypothetical protein FHP88_03320 [Sedimenticola selenatireducens]TVT65147.1 MAG: hypothetical protein FHK78_05685 [Sedimenticola selenatireducens]